MSVGHENRSFRLRDVEALDVVLLCTNPGVGHIVFSKRGMPPQQPNIMGKDSWKSTKQRVQSAAFTCWHVANTDFVAIRTEKSSTPPSPVLRTIPGAAKNVRRSEALKRYGNTASTPTNRALRTVEGASLPSASLIHPPTPPPNEANSAIPSRSRPNQPVLSFQTPTPHL